MQPSRKPLRCKPPRVRIPYSPPLHPLGRLGCSRSGVSATGKLAGANGTAFWRCFWGLDNNAADVTVGVALEPLTAQSESGIFRPTCTEGCGGPRCRVEAS